jgi:hypothetical protein
VNSPAWRAIDAATGAYVIPDGKGTTKGSVKLDYIDDPAFGWSSKWLVSTEIKNPSTNIRRSDMSFIECDETIGPEAKELLIALGMIPDNPRYDWKEQYQYHNNGIPESFMYRGGSYTTGAFGGVFVWSCSFGHEHIGVSQGFRASYIPL